MVTRVEMDAYLMLMWDVVLGLPIFWVKIVNWLVNLFVCLIKMIEWLDNSVSESVCQREAMAYYNTFSRRVINDTISLNQITQYCSWDSNSSLNESLNWFYLSQLEPSPNFATACTCTLATCGCVISYSLRFSKLCT